MPNWCYNNLEVQGTKEDMKEFYDKFKSNTKDDFDFEWFVPMPDVFKNIKVGGCTIDGVQYNNWIEHDDGTKTGLSDTQIEILKEEYGAKDWYDWSLNEWGCKWNCSQIEVLDVDDSLFLIKFETPWSPPEAFLSTFSEMFPNLDYRLEWEEEGGYAGIIEYVNGEHYYKEGEILYLTECCDCEATWDEEIKEDRCNICNDEDPHMYSEVRYLD